VPVAPGGAGQEQVGPRPGHADEQQAPLLGQVGPRPARRAFATGSGCGLEAGSVSPVGGGLEAGSVRPVRGGLEAGSVSPVRGGLEICLAAGPAVGTPGSGTA